MIWGAPVECISHNLFSNHDVSSLLWTSQVDQSTVFRNVLSETLPWAILIHSAHVSIGGNKLDFRMPRIRRFLIFRFRSYAVCQTGVSGVRGIRSRNANSPDLTLRFEINARYSACFWPQVFLCFQICPSFERRQRASENKSNNNATDR